jgi:hypothetical protein
VPQFAFASDTSLAVGPTTVVEQINRSIGIFTRTGQVQCVLNPQTNLWAGTQDCATAQGTDAVVRYDGHAGRWIFSRTSEGATPSTHVDCVAVSQGTDPTKGYYRYEFPTSVSSPTIDWHTDYEKIAVGTDAYYMWARARNTSSGSASNQLFYGSFILAYDKASMLAGNPAAEVEYFVPQTPASNSPTFYFLPADWDGAAPPPPGAPQPFIEDFDSTSSTSINVWDLKPNWGNPTMSTFSQTTTLPVAPYDTQPCPRSTGNTWGVPCVPQPPPTSGASPKLEASVGAIPMQRFVYRNLFDHQVLLASYTVAASPTDNRHTAILWYELTAPEAGGTWTVAQQGTYAPDANGRLLPSIAVDKVGDIAVGYNASGSSLYPSVRYTGRQPSDPPNQLSPTEVTLQQGGGSDNVSQFGDYSQMVIDPTNDCTFWYASLYFATPTDGKNHNFQTRIGAFTYPSCTTP